MQQLQEQPSSAAAAAKQYRDLLSECQNLHAKISELEMDRAEHALVEETLKPLEPDRRAYRLVGECLVERTVKEVLPSVVTNRENVSETFVVSKTCAINEISHNSCWLMFTPELFTTLDGEDYCGIAR